MSNQKCFNLLINGNSRRTTQRRTSGSGSSADQANNFVVFADSTIKDLDQQVWNTIYRRFSKGYQKSLKSHVKTYRRFCKLYKVKDLPITQWNLCRFAQYYAKFVESADTVKNAVYSLKSINELAGFAPVDTSKLLDWHLKGLKKVMPRPVNQAKALNPALLKRIRYVLDETDPVEVVAYVICLVGFFLFLRASNLVPGSRKDFDPNKQLARQDIRIYMNAVVVDIKWSKTVQFNEKLLQVPLLPVADVDICPVSWVLELLRQVPGEPMDPVFAVVERNKLVPVSYSQLRTRMKNWTNRLNLTNIRLTPHSMRRGGSTYAHRINISADAVQLIGDWASDAYKRYYTWSFKKRYDALKVMAEKAPRHARSEYSYDSVF